MSIVLSMAYLGNIQYFSKLATGRAVIEACENFQKQTYRNHCRIMTAGGIKVLTVPVVWDHNRKMPIAHVEIDYALPWQRTHWRTIRAAYASSPYFEHYAPHVEELICGVRYGELFELNNAVTKGLLGILKMDAELKFTTEYIPEYPGKEDFRDGISHKPRLAAHDPSFEAPKYYQVFNERLPFAANLSVLDLIFCEGPSARDIILESYKD